MNIIKQKRIEKGLTRREVAKQLGISIQRYMYFENHILSMPASKGYNLCILLGVDFNSI